MEYFKKSYRLSNKITNLANSFQSKLLQVKYEIDKIENQIDLFDDSEIKYHLISSYSIEDMLDIYKSFAIQYDIHENDICIQSNEIKIPREIDYEIRKKYNQRTNTMFETEEMYEYLKQEHGENSKTFKEEIKNIRRNKKRNFWNNRGTLKLSTIHSFKGWEVNTLFLILSNTNDIDDVLNDELIYTAITRCEKI